MECRATLAWGDEMMGRMGWSALLSAITMLTCGGTEVGAQGVDAIALESQHDALRVLRRGLVSSGGEDALAQIRTLALDMTVESRPLGQGSRPDAEGKEGRRTRYLFSSDLDTGHFFADVPSHDGSGKVVARVVVADQMFVHRIAPNSVQMVDDVEQLGGMVEVLVFAPRVLLAGWGRAASLRYLGRYQRNGRESEAITFSDSTGVQVSLAFDVESGLLMSTERVEAHPLFGDVVQAVGFADYRNVDGRMLPHTVTVPPLLQTACPPVRRRRAGRSRCSLACTSC